MNPELNLNDIHLPDSVSFWPPALGWWLLVGLIIGLAVGIGLFKRYLRQKAAYRLAFKQLKALHRFEGRDDGDVLSDLAVFLRRAAMTFDQRESVAALTGQKWLDYLNQNLNDRPFNGAIGAYLTAGAYQAQTSVQLQPEELWRVCLRWLKAQRKKR